MKTISIKVHGDKSQCEFLRLEIEIPHKNPEEAAKELVAWCMKNKYIKPSANEEMWNETVARLARRDEMSEDNFWKT